MLANIKKENGVVTAVYERRLNHPVHEVWAYLTENNKLKEWFSELEIRELKVGGEIWFDLQDGTFEKMDIIDLIPEKLFAFTWDKNAVRFELSTTENGCQLIFKEYLYEISEHTPKDLAGWHVCLDVVAALLRGQYIENRKAHWEKWYPQYQKALREVQY